MRRPVLIAAYVVVAVVALVRVASTHRVFSETLDEPVHIAAGLQWLSEGRYVTDESHPPLERVLSALPAWLGGATFPRDEKDPIQQGERILNGNGRYERTVARARYANLFFLIVLIWATATLARRVFPEPIPLIATAMLTLLPALLAHAGLATTDLAVTAALPVAAIAFDRWLLRCDFRHSVVLGLSLAFGVLSKFSFFVFFPVIAVVLIALRRRRPTLLSTAMALAISFVAIWAGYRFSFGRIAALGLNQEGYFIWSAPRSLWPLFESFAVTVPIPAPELPVGIAVLVLHDRGGQLAYLLGRYSEHGFWYYFPTILFFKTPLPFLLLALFGLLIITRRSRDVALQFVLVPILMLLAVMGTSINIGIRHILPVYPWLAVAAAVGLFTLVSKANVFTRAVSAVIVGWLIVNSAFAHPDYLAWFNEAAGDHPERIAVDSNLDWGQDILRLEKTVKRYGIDEINVRLATNAWLFEHGMPHAHELQPFTPVKGWVAVSETTLALTGRNGEFRWLDAYRPVARVGKTIRLYRIP